jgi:two-component system sensor histidine kinase TtrS
MRRPLSFRCASVTRRWLAAACLLAAPLAGAEALPAAAPTRIDIGVLAVLDGEETGRQWQPLADGLARALPGHRVHLQVFDPDALDAALAQRALHFVVTNPGHYVRLEARHGATRIATRTTAESDDPAHTVGSTVVVRAGTPVPTTLEALRGQRVAAVAEDAFGGYQLVAHEWLRNGLDAEAGAVQRVFTGFPMQRVADAVLAGRADAGILRTCVLEQLERTGRVAPGALVVVGARPDAPAGCQSSTPLYPGWAFAALASTPPELGRTVLLALLTQPADGQGGRWSVPADYQRVHDVLRSLQAEPYAFLRETRPQALLGRYWYWPAGMAALLLLGAAYMLRVEVLVKRRTFELSRSLRERERLAQQIAQGQEAMDHLSRLSILGELSATLAHELSHPLATIANYAASVQRRATRGNLTPDALALALQDIGQETERATRVIESIRALARKRVPVRALNDPVALANEAVALFCGLLGQAPPIRVECAQGSAGLRVPGDPQQIQQVLLNLLKNALDAHRAAGRADAPITITIERQGDRLAVAVQDQGAPLSDAERARLFEPFYTTRPDGLGLGLAICRGIAETHGGALQARPAGAAGEPGMVFELLLPLTPTATPQPQAPQETAP